MYLFIKEGNLTELVYFRNYNIIIRFKIFQGGFFKRIERVFLKDFTIKCLIEGKECCLESAKLKLNFKNEYCITNLTSTQNFHFITRNNY